MARLRLALRCRCLPRRVLSARLCCALLFISILASLLLSLQLYSHGSVLAWSCQDGGVWSCPTKTWRRRGKATPLIAVGTGAPFASSVPSSTRASWLSRAMTLLVSAFSDVLTGPAARSSTSSRWTYEKDADNLAMTSQQCQSAFPGLFAELARARSKHEKFHIVKEDLNSIPMTDGRVRAGILGGEVRKRKFLCCRHPSC